MKTLVAGIGNIFFSDDGFGSEVVRALAGTTFDGAKIEDFGIRGLHLAYELIAGYDRAIIIDAVARGGVPGTVYAIEPDVDAHGGTPDAHRMDLQNVFAFVRTLGGTPPPIILVGCEPETVDEGIGLSDAVQHAISNAVALVRRLLREPQAHVNMERNATWSAT